jgi:hypothetical protein
MMPDPVITSQSTPQTSQIIQTEPHPSIVKILNKHQISSKALTSVLQMHET